MDIIFGGSIDGRFRLYFDLTEDEWRDKELMQIATNDKVNTVIELLKTHGFKLELWDVED